MPLSTACDTTQMVPITVSPQTAENPPKPAQIDGALRVTVQSGTGTVLMDDTNPLRFFAVSGDVPGDTIYLIEADADLGGGETLIQDNVSLTVSGLNAASFGLSADNAVPKPAAAPSAARRRK